MNHLARVALATATILALANAPACAAAGAPRLEQAIAVTRVDGEGQKLDSVALRFDRAMTARGLTAEAIRVAGHKVVEVHVAASPEGGAGAAAGRYVIARLDPADPTLVLRQKVAMGGPPPGPNGPPPGPPLHFPEPVFAEPVAEASVAAPLHARDGATFPAGATVITSATRDPVMDSFRALTFHDPKTGDTLHYNLFVPKAARGKPLPLVLFMHDASVTGHNVRATLQQGLGAIVWASPADQARHPAIVLAPQYEDVIANDQSETTSARETTRDLILALQQRYRIDARRIYATGQSGGAMMTIALNIRYPDLFAASYIVAGQWDAQKARPLARNKLWIMVAEGDLKAFPGENAMTAAWETDGARIERDRWDGRSDPAQFAASAAHMIARHTPINYVVLTRGTVVPAGQDDNGGSNHVNTWRIAYTIPAIRDWLFAQHR